MHLHTPAHKLRQEFQGGTNMTGVIKSAIVAVIAGFLAFFGFAFLFLALSLLITYYDVTTAKLVAATCQSDSGCYFPPASTIIRICFIAGIIVAVSIFVAVWRYRGKGRSAHLIEVLKQEKDDFVRQTERHRAKDDVQET